MVIQACTQELANERSGWWWIHILLQVSNIATFLQEYLTLFPIPAEVWKHSFRSPLETHNNGFHQREIPVNFIAMQVSSLHMRDHSSKEVCWLSPTNATQNDRIISSNNGQQIRHAQSSGSRNAYRQSSERNDSRIWDTCHLPLISTQSSLHVN